MMHIGIPCYSSSYELDTIFSRHKNYVDEFIYPDISTIKYYIL